MQSPPFPRYLVPSRSKYSPLHLVLKHPQLAFLPLFLTDFNVPFSTDFLKNSQKSNLVKICPVGDELFHADGQTNRRKGGHDEANSHVAILLKRLITAYLYVNKFENVQHIIHFKQFLNKCV